MVLPAASAVPGLNFDGSADAGEPSVTITGAVSNPTNASSFTVTFTFSEAVVDFDVNDILISNGQLSNFSGSDDVYTATVTPVANTMVTVGVAAGVAVDTEGNLNTAAEPFQRVSDQTGPSLQITSTAGNPTNANAIPVTFTFNESVSGFDVFDVTILGGLIQSFSGSGTTYTANIVPSGDGVINLFVFQNASVDAAGNGNTFSTFSIISDRTKPTVTITSTESSPTSMNPIPITFQFSENVTNFVVQDITVTGGTLTNFSGSGSQYTVSLIPSGSGNKTVRLNANVLNDAAGNTNNASSTFVIFYLAYCSQTTTWNGLFWTNGDPVPSQPAVIAADYDTNSVNPGGFTACSLIIGNNANVRIDPGSVISIGGNISILAGSALTIEPGATLYAGGTISAGGLITVRSDANLVQNPATTTNANTGNIIVERNVGVWRQDYVFWGSPVNQDSSLMENVDDTIVQMQGSTLRSFSPLTLSNRFYKLEGQSTGFVGLFGQNDTPGIEDPATYEFAAGKGYMIRSPNTFPNPDTVPEQPTFTGRFIGVPNNGTVTLPTVNGVSPFHLLSNPYPSPIKAGSENGGFLDVNEGGTVHFFTHHDQIAGSNNYASYNGMGGTAAYPGGVEPTGVIQVGQGFLFENGGALASVTFTNAMRVADSGAPFFRTAPADKSRIWLNLQQGEIKGNQMMVGYTENATEGADPGLDGRLIPGGNCLGSLIGQDAYAIQARPAFSTDDIVPLSLHAVTSGTFTISLDHADGLFEDAQDIFLKDNVSGTITNLKEGVYSFVSTEGDFTHRFQLQYTAGTLSAPEFTADSVTVYSQNGFLTVEASQNMKAVAVYDIRGRRLYSKDAIGATSLTIDTLKAGRQVVIVKVTSEDGSVTTKKTGL